MTIPRIALIAAVVILFGVVFDALFGTDSGGFRHAFSVACFLAAVVGFVVLVVCALVALVRRVGGGASRSVR